MRLPQIAGSSEGAVHQQGFTTGVFLGSRQSHDWLSARPRGRGEDTSLKRVEHFSSYNIIKHNAIISNNIKKFKLVSTLILMVLINKKIIMIVIIKNYL